jgi:hypothetical protein
MADAECGLGRPERALALAASDEAETLDRVGKIEMALVASGARSDLGEYDAALAVLDGLPPLKGDLDLRAQLARAAALEAAGRLDEATAILAELDPDEVERVSGNVAVEDDVVVYDTYDEEADDEDPDDEGEWVDDDEEIEGIDIDGPTSEDLEYEEELEEAEETMDELTGDRDESPYRVSPDVFDDGDEMDADVSDDEDDRDERDERGTDLADDDEDDESWNSDESSVFADGRDVDFDEIEEKRDVWDDEDIVDEVAPTDSEDYEPSDVDDEDIEDSDDRDGEDEDGQ